jgi:urease accessory protein
MSAPAALAAASTFAANRARGRIELEVAAFDGITRVSRLREEGSLRARFPNGAPGTKEAVILNTAGGMAGGDEFSLDLNIGAGASLAVTTAAAEKVYRSLQPPARVDVRISLAGDATLAWLPQETILFDRARLARTVSIELTEESRLLLAEAVVFGRGAMGERVEQGSFIDRWRVRRGGRLVYAEGVRLEHEIDAKLRRAACGDGATAIATVLIIPGDEGIVAAVRERAADFRGDAGASAWNGMAAVRLMAREAAALRHDLALVVGACGQRLPRIWQN